jgi:hypothetical protein
LDESIANMVRQKIKQIPVFNPFFSSNKIQLKNTGLMKAALACQKKLTGK